MKVSLAALVHRTLGVSPHGAFAKLQKRICGLCMEMQESVQPSLGSGDGKMWLHLVEPRSVGEHLNLFTILASSSSPIENKGSPMGGGNQ